MKVGVLREKKRTIHINRLKEHQGKEKRIVWKERKTMQNRKREKERERER